MQQAIKTAQKISAECWKAFKTFMQSEHTGPDWESYIDNGNQFDACDKADKELFLALYLAFLNYAEAKIKESKK